MATTAPSPAQPSGAAGVAGTPPQGTPAAPPPRKGVTPAPVAPAAPPPARGSTPSAAAAAPPSSSTPTPIAPALGQAAVSDLASLLNLPVRLSLVASGDLAPREVSGTLWTYDSATSLVVLTTPATTTTQGDTTTVSNPTTAQNPPSSKRSYHLIKTTQIRSVSVLSLVPDASLPSPLEPLRALNPVEATARVEKAVQEDKKQRARVGQGVSEEAQALFDALGKTLPVRWHGTEIVVMDEVLISEPYRTSDVKGGKGSQERIERVKKVLEGERQRRAARQAGFP